jgi:hypothetical protein
MFFLLLGGGQYFYANTSNKNNTAVNKSLKEKHLRKIDSNSFSSFIENTDLDNEEEFNVQKENKEELKIYSNSHFYINTNFSNCYNTLNYISLKNQISIYFHQSNTPLYLSQRVLRI